MDFGKREYFHFLKIFSSTSHASSSSHANITSLNQLQYHHQVTLHIRLWFQLFPLLNHFQSQQDWASEVYGFREEPVLIFTDEENSDNGVLSTLSYIIIANAI